jgi:uncharacterized membrane protein
VILNGTAIPDWLPPAEGAAKYTAVVTHEVGHALNLDHSQTNGDVFLFFSPVGPEGCTPFDGFPEPAHIETMYPFVNVASYGEEVATIDRLDDIAAFSDIYPAAGWPDSKPSISGTIYLPGFLRHGHGGRQRRREQYTGANVVARNAANPYGDAISAISGNYTQGLTGPDGSYAFHGLTPNASYLVYVDGIQAGAFATPLRTVLPGPEEFHNGFMESGLGNTDERCEATGVVPRIDCTRDVDIVFNKVWGAPVWGAPEFIPVELPESGVSALSGNGETAVGTWGGGMYRWTKEGGPVDIGGSYATSSPGISDNGEWITGAVIDTATWGTEVDVAAVYHDGAWSRLPLVPGNEPCDRFLTSGWDVADDGKVVGLSWRNCTDVSAFEGTVASGITELGYVPGSDIPGSRANAVTADGRTIVGWDQDSTGFWRAARWDDGVESLIELNTPAICGNDPSEPWYLQSNPGSAYGISSDGSAIVGECFPVERIVDWGDGPFRYCDCEAWRWTPSTGVESLGAFQYPDYRPYASDISDDGRVVVGGALPNSPWEPPRPAIWTRATGMIDFQEFLEAQGTFAPDWTIYSATSVSADGRTIAGNAATPFGFLGFVVEIPKAVVCHRSSWLPWFKLSLPVPFPEGLEAHLAHGDTLGTCPEGF